jgi:hypothetical protein
VSVVGQPFQPTPFATTYVSPTVNSLFKRQPYIGLSEFQNAPTAVATNKLVPNGTSAQSSQALADVIMRASGWIDEYCFHSSDGTLAASVSVESSPVRAKNGAIRLICKYRPILEVQGIALGQNANQLSSLTTNPGIRVDGKIITIPPTNLGGGIPGDYLPGLVAGWGGYWYASWSYVNGFPHTALAANVDADASSIVVEPTLPDGSSVCGIYAGTQLTIFDGVNTETVVASAAPSTTTIELAAPTQYAHTLPAAPDTIRVSSIPRAVEQACISLTSCLIKVRGMRGMVMPTAPGTGTPSKQAVAQAGGLADQELAYELLKPFRTAVSWQQ